MFSELPVSNEKGMNNIFGQVRNVILGKDTVMNSLKGAILLTAVLKRLSEGRKIPETRTLEYAVFKDTDVHVLPGA